VLARVLHSIGARGHAGPGRATLRGAQGEPTMYSAPTRSALEACYGDDVAAGHLQAICERVAEGLWPAATVRVALPGAVVRVFRIEASGAFHFVRDERTGRAAVSPAAVCDTVCGPNDCKGICAEDEPAALAREARAALRECQTEGHVWHRNPAAGCGRCGLIDEARAAREFRF
jgi:hypothetical protein